jgi:hypothetical protein
MDRETLTGAIVPFSKMLLFPKNPIAPNRVTRTPTTGDLQHCRPFDQLDRVPAGDCLQCCPPGASRKLARRDRRHDLPLAAASA